MLRFILGIAGTGKTTRLVQQIVEAVQSGKKALLVVPEQFSFEGEKMLYDALGPGGLLNVEVLSFTRLCNNIFRRYGGLAGNHVTPPAKYLLMSSALDELKDSLELYRKSSANPSFVGSMLEVVAECKSAGVSPQQLEAFALQCPQEPFRQKTQELASIYSAYQAMLEKSYVDSDDDLLRACRLLEQGNDYFADYHVFVDGFMAFMAGEFRLLEHAIAQSESVCMAFTADSIVDEQQGMGVFSPVKSTMKKLMRAAQRSSTPIAAPLLLVEPHRFENAELSAISTGVLGCIPDAEPTQEAPVHIQVVQARDRYEELEFVAATLQKLVREKGLSYREIALVARSMDAYTSVVESIFSQYNIPVFMDSREEAESKPLMSCVLQALEAVLSGLDSTVLLSLAKSPVLGFDLAGVNQLENYCFRWNVSGKAWREAFCNNPKGLAEEMTEKEAAELAQINQLRSSLISPLLHLGEALQDCTGQRFAQSIFEYLEEVAATGHITTYAARLPEAQQNAFLDENAQLWDFLMEVLDAFAMVLGQRKLPLRRLAELLRLAVATGDIGFIPQTLDQVIAGSADRIRPGKVKAVFVLGANEGIFPAQCRGGGVFSDEERLALQEAGIELSHPAFEKSIMEKYFAYFALTLPSQSLCISFPVSDLTGSVLYPSLLVESVRQLFPNLQVKSAALPVADKILNIGAARQALAESYGNNTPEYAALACCLQQNGEDAFLSHIQQVADKQPRHLVSSQRAMQLFGKRLRLSPSKIEAYYRCPYAYYAAEGLRVRPRTRVEYSPLESGNVLHTVLQAMLKEYGAAGIAAMDDATLRENIGGIIHTYLAARVENMEQLPARFKYLFRRLVGTLYRILRHIAEELLQSAFQPAEFELPIVPGGKVEPLELITAKGESVTVEGVVDRLDIMQKEGRLFFRVVDYKSGRKEFELSDVLFGLNMQMLLYLYTIEKNATGPLAGATGTGVLYMPVRESYISAGRDTPEDKLEQTRKKNLCMNGLLLEDEDVLSGMEPEIKGVYIPVKRRRDGSLDTSALAANQQMGALGRKVISMATEMVEALREGKIAAVPADSASYKPCAYCPYWAMCGFEDGDPIKSIAKVDKERFYGMLEEEGHGG